MSVTMKGYANGNPNHATRQMRRFMASPDTCCPMCGRAPKWYYSFYEPTSKKDSRYRCALHEINPIPGPEFEEDAYKVDQLY
jgi:hypothetical protein